MKLALAWRDNIIAKHPPMSLMKFCSILRSNNTSGMAGIGRNVKRRGAKNGRITETVYWKSRVPMADGKSRIRNFSVSKLGEDGAKLRAIEDRIQGLRELGDVAFREKRLPQPGSSAEDIALMAETLRAPAERRMRQIAELCAKREQHALRVADMLAQALAAEEAALDRIEKRDGEQYIGRYATPKGTSFYWRVSFHRQGTHHRKCFSDSVYGGTAEALVAAKTWRDRLFCTLPVDSKAAFVARVKATNTSGVAGVNRMTAARKGEIFYAWVAHAPQTRGVPRRTKQYSIAKYGEEEAFALAVSAREAFVAELREIEFLQHPAARLLKLCGQ